MKNNIFLVFGLYVSLFISFNVQIIDTNCVPGSKCPKTNEICSRLTRQCECKEGTHRFTGSCLGVSHYGERCQEQYECIQSGDPHLHCTNKICRCGNGKGYNPKTKKCEDSKNIPQRSQDGYHFKKMTPKQTRRSVVELTKEHKDIKHVG